MEEIFELTFPDELYGEAIAGIDLMILSLDSMRLIDAYAKQDGELSDIQYSVLRQCDEELTIVIPALAADAQKYFQKIHSGVKDVIQSCDLFGGV